MEPPQPRIVKISTHNANPRREQCGLRSNRSATGGSLTGSTFWPTIPARAIARDNLKKRLAAER